MCARWVPMVFVTVVLLAAPPGRPGRADDLGDGIRELSLTACRSPREPGCTTCCRAPDDGKCTQLRWTGGPESNATPWYNATESLKRCPDGCPPCARCLARDADELATLKTDQPADCDCAAIENGVDPCHAPLSCACFCERYRRLTAKCGG